MNRPEYRLERIRFEELKGRTDEIDLENVNIFHGPNGSWKTTILVAIYLLVNKKPPAAPGITENHKGVMRFTRGDRLLVQGWFSGGDGRAFMLQREWKRKSDGSVTCVTTTNLGTMSEQEVEAKLEKILGAFKETWHPSLILGLSGDELRKTLLRLIPQAEISLAAIVPKEVPAWAKPSDYQAPHEWVEWAIKQASKKTNDERADARRAEEQLVEYQDSKEKPQSSVNLEKELRALQIELAESKSLEAARSRLEAAVKELDRLRHDASTDVAALDLARMVRGVVEYVAAHILDVTKRVNAEHAKLTRERDQITRELRTPEMQRATAATEADVEAIVIEEQELTARMQALKTERDRLDTEIDQYNQLIALLCECPRCKEDLGAIWRAEIAKRTPVRNEKDAEMDVLETVAEEIDARLVAARLGARKAKLEDDQAILDAQRAELDEELLQLPNDEVLGDLVATLNESRGIELNGRLPAIEQLLVIAREDVARVEAHDVAVAAFDRQFDAVEKLDKELAALKPRASSKEIEADITKITQKLKAIGAENERAESKVKLQIKLKESQERAAAAVAWDAKFTAIQNDLLQRSKEWLEVQFETIIGQPATVELVDAKGNPACRFAIGDADAAALSDGEMSQFLAAIVRIYASTSSAPYRPLFVDRLESVSLEARVSFLERLRDDVASGLLSQVFAAGCPDTRPEIDGAKTFDMKREAA